MQSGIEGEHQESRLAALRRRLAARTDTEHEVGFIRIGFALSLFILFVVTAGSIGTAATEPIVLVSGAAVLASIVLLAFAAADMRPSPVRRLLGAGLEQGYAYAALWLVGPAGAPLFALSMLHVVCNALRFGKWYGYFSGSLGAWGCAGLIAFDPAWQGMGTVVLSWAVALLAVPAYAAMLAERIHATGKRYRKHAMRMERRAMLDPLTRLANRSHFASLAERSLKLAKQTLDPEAGFAILYCDLDGFKSVNDTYGHHIGDALLIAVGRRMRACVRSGDVIARLGGDEFAILLPRIQDPAIAGRIGQDIVRRVGAIDNVDGSPINVSCSVGITAVAAPAHLEETLDTVLARADEAMYRAKNAGKNRCVMLKAA